MILELFESLCVTTAGRAARALGYARETASLEARHRRLEAAWGSHLCATQSALLEAADAAQDPHGVALVIGGGVSEDLSLSDLAACFAEVWLVDIAFSRQTRARVRRWGGRIRCLHVDVTGVVQTLWRTRTLPAETALPHRLPLSLPPNLSWIASVNCLTQLPLLPAAWLLKHGVEENRVEAFAQSLIKLHIEQLSSTHVPVCLITESEEQHLAARGRLLEHIDYRPLLLPCLKAVNAHLLAQWDWETQPRGELPNGESVISHVMAWTFAPQTETPRMPHA